jgi:hypothetical protein
MPVAARGLGGDVEFETRPVETRGLPDGFDVCLFQGEDDAEPPEDDVLAELGRNEL